MSCYQCEIDNCIMCGEKWYSDLSHTAVCAIRGMISTQTYQPGEVIFQKDAPSSYLYILKKGQVKLISPMPGGREQIVGLISPGHLLGVDTLDDQFYRYSATTTGAIIVCKFRHKTMLRALSKDPAITARLVKDLNSKLGQTRALIEAMGHRTATEKIASCILSIQPHDEPAHEKMPLQITRLDLAEMLGLTEETVCRVMAEFRRMGIIEAPRGKIFVRERDQLQDIADEKPLTSDESLERLAAQ